MKILLFGSSGKLGTAIEKVCQDKNIDYIGLTHSDIEITNKFELKEIIEKHNPTAIINAASLVGITQCEDEPQKSFEVNSTAVNNLARICQKKNITLVQTSTIAVFDGNKDGEYTEEDLPNPTSVYSASKYAGECFVKNICEKYYIFRFPLLFGNRRNNSVGFVDKILTWIEEGKDLKIADDKIDSFAYTKDVAEEIVSILEKKLPYGVYHLSNEGKENYFNFVNEMVKILDVNVKITKAKHDDFGFKDVHYPKKTSIKSVKLPSIRNWKEALGEYLNSGVKENLKTKLKTKFDGCSDESNEQQTQNKPKLLLDGTKLPYHLDRVKAWMNGERIAPITVEWALSTRCNYKCKYCNYDYASEDRVGAEHTITKEMAFKFIDDAAEIGVKAIPLGSDGESAFNPIVYDVIPYAKKKGLDIGMSTNGSLLKDSELENILPCLSYLRFNVSGGESKRYAELMGCTEAHFHKVYQTIKRCVEIKKEKGLGVTIGLQMVLMPEFGDQIIPMAKLGKELEVDYVVIKHCAENPERSLGIDYDKYNELIPLLKEAESYSTDKYKVIAKWSKLLSGGKRGYKCCFGPPFMIQIAGSGKIGPCGTFQGDKFENFSAGNISEKSFKEIWQSEKYWEIMNFVSSEKFNNDVCWPLCFQHKVNEFLWGLKQGKINLEDCKPSGPSPAHVNFI